jgi:sulfur carrier protein
MIIIVNGKEQEIKDNSTIEGLLEKISQKNERIAIEINNEIISASNYNKFLLKNGDKIEIIKAVGGG